MDITYISREHEVIVEPYLSLVHSSMKEMLVEDTSRYSEFMDVASSILDYHNQYSEGEVGGYIEFLSIIPVNYLVMIKGFMAGYSNESNRSDVRMYSHLLTEYSHRVVDDLSKLETTYE